MYTYIHLCVNVCQCVCLPLYLCVVNEVLPEAAPHFPRAAHTPLNVDRILLSTISPGIVNVVMFAPIDITATSIHKQANNKSLCFLRIPKAADRTRNPHAVIRKDVIWRSFSPSAGTRNTLTNVARLLVNMLIKYLMHIGLSVASSLMPRASPVSEPGRCQKSSSRREELQSSR
jgi:hypothetical protein